MKRLLLTAILALVTINMTAQAESGKPPRSGLQFRRTLWKTTSGARWSSYP